MSIAATLSTVTLYSTVVIIIIGTGTNMAVKTTNVMLIRVKSNSGTIQDVNNWAMGTCTDALIEVTNVVLIRIFWQICFTAISNCLLKNMPVLMTLYCTEVGIVDALVDAYDCPFSFCRFVGFLIECIFCHCRMTYWMLLLPWSFLRKLFRESASTSLQPLSTI